MRLKRIAVLAGMILVIGAVCAYAVTGSERAEPSPAQGASEWRRGTDDVGAPPWVTQEQKEREQQKVVLTVVFLILAVLAALTMTGRVPWALFVGALVLNFVLLWCFSLFSPFLFLFIPIGFWALGRRFVRVRRELGATLLYPEEYAVPSAPVPTPRVARVVEASSPRVSTPSAHEMSRKRAPVPRSQPVAPPRPLSRRLVVQRRVRVWPALKQTILPDAPRRQVQRHSKPAPQSSRQNRGQQGSQGRQQ